MSEPNFSHCYVDGSDPCLEAPWLHLIGLFNVAASISSRVLTYAVLVKSWSLTWTIKTTSYLSSASRTDLAWIAENSRIFAGRLSSEVATMQYVRPQWHTSTLFLLSFILALKWTVAVLGLQGGWSGSEQHLGRHGGLKTGDIFTASCRHSPRDRFSAL